MYLLPLLKLCVVLLEQTIADTDGCPPPLQQDPETRHSRTSYAGSSSNISSTHQQLQSASVVRRWLNVVCGLPENETTGHAEVEESHAERMKLLKERPFVRRILNANAVIGITITIFLCGLYY